MNFEEHIIPSFENKEATRLVENILFRLSPITMQDDYEINTLQLTEGVVELNDRKAFLEGVANYLGFVDATNPEQMLNEVKRRYAIKGIELKKAVQGWFRNGVTPSTSQPYRRNLYDFCYALDMDVHTMAEFFCKSFLTIPFNYKNADDAVYCYCINTGKDYATVRRLLKIADGLSPTNKEIDNTEQLGRQILAIDTDDDFEQYLRQHCYDRKRQYATAKRKIAYYVAENKKNVPGKDNNETEKTGTQKNSALMASILGYRYQMLDEKQRNHMKKCNLPTFPRDGDIDDIISPDSEASFDTLRKALILMKFYNFYRGMEKEQKKTDTKDIEKIYDFINGNLYDFFDETNKELAECGFVQMYIRNPFDWIILFCANSIAPISCLQDFLQKRYLGELED